MSVREESYKKYIINELNNIEDTYTNDEFLNNMNETINEILIKIINATKKESYGYALSYCNDLEKRIENIIDNSLSINVLNKMKEIYTNENLLTNMINNYYSIVIPAYEEFNYTFLNKHFIIHVDQYISKPTELITKFKQIELSQRNEKEKQIENINNLLIDSINNGIENSYNKIYQLVKNIKLEFNSKSC